MLRACGQQRVSGLRTYGSVRLLSQLADLSMGDISQTSTIGLISCRSAPPGLEVDVISALSGLGPLSVWRREIFTRADSALDVAVDPVLPGAREQGVSGNTERTSTQAG